MKKESQNVSRSLMIVVAISAFISGLFLGIGVMMVSKTSRALDDAHEVKQDYDKAKVVVVDDYKKTRKEVGAVGKKSSLKAQESIQNMDAEALGEAATEGSKEIGGVFKRALISKIKKFDKPGPCTNCGCRNSSAKTLADEQPVIKEAKDKD